MLCSGLTTQYLGIARREESDRTLGEKTGTHFQSYRHLKRSRCKQTSGGGAGEATGHEASSSGTGRSPEGMDEYHAKFPLPGETPEKQDAGPQMEYAALSCI